MQTQLLCVYTHGEGLDASVSAAVPEGEQSVQCLQAAQLDPAAELDRSWTGAGSELDLSWTGAETPGQDRDLGCWQTAGWQFGIIIFLFRVLGILLRVFSPLLLSVLG